MKAEVLDRVTDLSDAAAQFEAGVGQVKEAVADAAEDGIATTKRSLKQGRRAAEDLIDDAEASCQTTSAQHARHVVRRWSGIGRGDRVYAEPHSVFGQIGIHAQELKERFHMVTATTTDAEWDVNSNVNTIAGNRIGQGRAPQAAGGQLKHEWAVILAGGDGTRLRSLTRKITGDERPKQFCSLIGQNTLLEETQKRVGLELAKARTMFVVNRAHERYYSKVLGNALSNLIEQPRNIGTAPAILYSVLKIASMDPQAVVAFFPSDHYVSDDARFMAHIRQAVDAAHLRRDLVILLGVEPESPETEYGWIEPGQPIQGHKQLHRVGRFWEKPSSDLAAVLQLRGCLWNSFVMVASAQALLDTIATATPALYEAFAPIMPFIGTDDEPTLIENLYAPEGEINFSDRVLALVPERLAVLRVRGVRWSDLGAPKRALAIRMNGRRAAPVGGSMLTLSIDRSSAMTWAAEHASAEPAEPNLCPGDLCGSLAAGTVQVNEKNNCTRCLKATQARYRVYTDVIDMAVCPACAEEARSLEISVEQLDQV